MSEPPIRRVLLLGGNSEIGLATVRALDLPPDAEVILAGRRRDQLEDAAFRLSCAARVEDFDALDEGSTAALFDRLATRGPVDVVILAFGVLGDQQRAETDVAHALEIIDVDFRAQAAALLHAYRLLQRQGGGTIAVLSSIAGVRARRANFVYGAAKAGLDAFASGLADRAAGTDVHVVVARPGFVVGRMTAGMRPAPFATTPAAVGSAVATAIRRRQPVVWVPRRLAAVAWLMRLTPRFLWRRVPR